MNHELVKENSAFNRVSHQNPQMIPFHEEKPSVMHSLPLSAAEFEQRNSTGPQYITQNSMVENIGRAS